MSDLDDALILSVQAPDAEDAARGVRDLRRLLEENVPEAAVTAPSAPATPGAKGEPITMTLLVALIHSGAVTAFIGALKAFLLRDQSVSIEVKRKNGDSIKISAKNMDERRLEELIAAVRR